MAYVAITSTLQSEVSSTIENMRNAELSTMKRPQDRATEIANSEAVAILVRNRLWEPIEHLRPQLEQYSRTQLVRILADVAHPDNGDLRFSFSNDLYLKSVPCIYETRAATDPYNARTTDVAIDAEDVPELLTWVEECAAFAEANKRWDAVKKQVTEFLQSCKSLNEAVRLWPDVIRYIPQPYLDRLKQKVEKVVEASKALDALRKMDFDQINTSTVLARMAGAK
jgi:hypothetical protein